MYENQVINNNMATYVSNVLFKQEFNAWQDITISFLHTPPTSNTFNGLAIFLVDGAIPSLTGGGTGSSNPAFASFDPGIGMVTDSPTSAISGLLLAVAKDQSGAFSTANSIAQFTGGGANRINSTGNIAARKYDSGTSTFPFISSVKSFATPFNVDSQVLFRVSFKRKLQEIVIYKDIQTPDITIKTYFDLNSIPDTVKVGLSYSGDGICYVRNIAINGDAV